MSRWLILALLILQVGSATAEYQVTTAQGDEIPVTRYAANGSDLILWLPSEFGVSPRRAALARRLAERGIEVWSPDLHAAWFLPVGRYSLNDVEPSVVAAVLDDALRHSGKTVYLMAEGRSAALALAAARAWQAAYDATGTLAGLLAFNPNLYVRTPQGGERAEYLPVAAASNLPVYLLQPEDSAGFWRTADDVRELEKGGSAVFVHRLPGVAAGFYARPDYTDAEDAMTRRLPDILDAAMRQLAAFGGAPADPAPLDAPHRAPERTAGDALLRPYATPRDAPALRLPDLRGEPVDLAALRGRVVMVNFWTTWCPPCVEEIPSLQRLYRALRPAGLEILAVDVGESAQTVQAFLRDKPVAFPVLIDRDGDALRRWGVYAFPTTLVLDRSHRIRYAVFGAFDWSSDEVVDTLRPLLDEGAVRAAGPPPRP